MPAPARRFDWPARPPIQPLSVRSKDEISVVKIRRDKVYTLLSERVKAIREVGQYVFWRKPERKAKYVNNYK